MHDDFHICKLLFPFAHYVTSHWGRNWFCRGENEFSVLFSSYNRALGRIPVSSNDMKLTNHSSVPVYTISGSSTARPLPEWLARKRKRSLKNDPEYASRIELLQDFEFEEASQCIRVSDDGQWVMSTGNTECAVDSAWIEAHLKTRYL